ncbi:MAG: glycosyltransferase family 39 protein [Alphaproteobacteria bacterium]|nr:glycosyltransferase family 39 protein [Alphaproteobacteria bacterium]
MAQEQQGSTAVNTLKMWKLLFDVAALLFALRVLVAIQTDLSLHGDEAQYWTWSWTFDFGYYSKPPLIAWVIGAVTDVCGDSAWCIRAPAALFQAATALVLAGAARVWFDNRIAFWTGIVWLTLPAVSLSSLIMSTDALLLFFWAGCLWAYGSMMRRPSWLAAIALALCFGLGLNAKYAMAYFLICLLVHLVICPQARQQVRSAAVQLVVGFGVGAAAILPNVWWNKVHGWATVGHTADNVHWQGIVLHFKELADFLGAQFGVFGPILFVVLLLAIPRSRRACQALSEPARLLLAFSLPILLIISVQAILSRANANWAATAYPAAVILVTSILLAQSRRRWWLWGSIALHLIVAGALYTAVLMPGPAARALGRDPFAELSGWDQVAAEVSQTMKADDLSVLLMDNRMMIASMAYALRRQPNIIIRAWNHDAKIDHHYEMAWPYKPAVDGRRVLLLTPHGAESIESHFSKVTKLLPIEKTDRVGRTKTLELRVLEDPK